MRSLSCVYTSNLTTGSSAVTSFIETNPWSIGYLESGHGKELAVVGIHEIALKNKEGEFLTSSTANVADAADNYDQIFPTGFEDWSDVSLINMGGAKTWPITLITYVYVRTDLSGLGSSGAVLLAFLDSVLRDQGQDLLEAYAFVKLPASLSSINIKTMEGLNLPSSVARFEFEDSTTRPYAGASSMVLSKKRGSIQEVQIEALQKKVDVLVAELARNEARDEMNRTRAAASRECGCFGVECV